MLNKLSIEDDLKVDHSEGKLCNIIKRLQLNIPQVSSYLYLLSIQLNGLPAVYTRDRWSGGGVLDSFNFKIIPNLPLCCNNAINSTFKVICFVGNIFT